ncbi:MAG: histidinol-phosphatase [Oceanicaulis sp.]
MTPDARTHTDDEADLTFARRLADAARPIALAHFRSASTAVDAKPGADFDPVTEADRGVEAALRDLIARERPGDAVLGEEAGATAGRSGRTWVLDPIDGTRAFIAGLPTWTVLIALSDQGGPRLSVIDQPFTGERFTGLTAGGAWLETGEGRRKLATRGCTALSGAIISTTDPYLFTGAEADAFETIRKRSKLARYGLDAYAYAALAMGGVDLVVESGLKSWDVAALMPVVHGAGGVVTGWRGEPCHEGGRVVAAATEALHAEALEILAAV